MKLRQSLFVVGLFFAGGAQAKMCPNRLISEHIRSEKFESLRDAGKVFKAAHIQGSVRASGNSKAAIDEIIDGAGPSVDKGEATKKLRAYRENLERASKALEDCDESNDGILKKRHFKNYLKTLDPIHSHLKKMEEKKYTKEKDLESDLAKLEELIAKHEKENLVIMERANEVRPPESSQPEGGAR